MRRDSAAVGPGGRGVRRVCLKAAHNLREPLRDVAAFSELMAETYDGRIDSDADTYLERMREGAARMQSLLTDVVDYWTTNHGGGRPSGQTWKQSFATRCY